MAVVKAPRSLRSFDRTNLVKEVFDARTGRKVTVGCMIAVASFTAAEAQDSSLPPVTVDAPVVRKKPPASKPSAEQLRARAALRAAHARQAEQAKQAAAASANQAAPDADPYANPASPYEAQHLQASGKFPEPILNTPKTITVLTKQYLEDKNATTLKQAILSTAGVTLGSGEGGNAFGDRFFIRGFDARNDVFIDGVRDSGVSVRENFFTDQIEILRGPGSSFAGRGTTGGAINIVTKQANTDKSFYNEDTTFGTDATKRIQLDVNQVIDPTLAIRAGGMFQDAGVAGRAYTTDDRDGEFVAAKWKPTEKIKVTADYIHTYLHGIPDFGVPYYRPGATGVSGQTFTTTAGGPYPDFGANRNNFYGFVNRDFFRVQQDIATLNTEVQLAPDLLFTDKTRYSQSFNNYIGTLPESPISSLTPPAPAVPLTLTANPQSRYQVTDVVANQSELTYKFYNSGFKHTLLTGLEVDRETSLIDKYAGLSSEGASGAFSGTGSLTGVSIFQPESTFIPFGSPSLVGMPTKIAIDTQSVYAIDTANYNDIVILNGGIRYDDYNIHTSGWGTVNGTSTFGAQAANFGMPNFNLGLTYKPLPNGSVYVAYATSSNPVGAEFDGTSTAYGGLSPVLNGNSSQIFGPEQNRAAEVGTKWELFDRRLLVTGALFKTTKDNAREAYNVTAATATANCPYTATSGSVSCISAGAAYYVQGIDLEAAGKITDKWSMFGGLVLMQSKVTKSNLSGIYMPEPALYTTNVGLPLANVAHQSFSLLNKYQVTDKLELGGSAVYRSKIYGGTLLAANQGTSIPSYWRFDTFAEYKLDKHWTAKVFVNNIFNKTYYDALYQSATPFVLEAPGRVAYLVLSARY
jgi:catecholate siderophore receptor